MTINRVKENDGTKLKEIADLFCPASKVVIVTGAGISTNAGIPDFRSEDGKYSRHGRSIFYSSTLINPLERSRFYHETTKIRQMVKNANPTETHRFIKSLRDTGQLVRDYTQNIDCLEEKVGLCTGLQKEPGSMSGDAKEVECVLLHGSLRLLRCFLCLKPHNWDEGKREEKTLSGNEPRCPSCAKASADRAAKGKRATAIGTLRPDIVLYDESNPQADFITDIIQIDLEQCPDIILVMGTSLKIHGVQHLIRAFAKAAHKQKGKVIYVNRTKPPKNWDGVIDYWVQQDCDIWVQDLMKRQPALSSGTARSGPCMTTSTHVKS
ncbi:DHS-like NAD/FAD-binding domain-containing protein [Colletotrichum somersetense]|nr:DHS-like NAD/FAD-binding domain-containing protein [Colletotrichum somersetense]